MIPESLRGAFDILNAGRANVGSPPLRWDDRLARISRELVDWAHEHKRRGGNVMADAHHDHFGRIERSGWPYDRSSIPPGARPGIGNTSECGCPSEGNDQYPEKSPEDHAKNIVWMLTESNLSEDLREGHVWDFRLPSWTHWGFAHRGGFFAINYGYLPGEPEPEPTPGPAPEPDDNPYHVEVG